jgi:uncharacterized damage-inducible protein DinB
MDGRELLKDAFGRIKGGVERVTDGLDAAALEYRPDAEANSIGWLVWHLTRVQDHHVSDIAKRGQVWVEQGWADRFGMAADPDDIGYGHNSEQVAAVRPNTPALLQQYHDAVNARTIEYLDTVDEVELERIVDERWDPPVSAGVRLVSVIGDDLQHIGQAAYVRGLWERRS